jgi:hypothetical protein
MNDIQEANFVKPVAEPLPVVRSAGEQAMAEVARQCREVTPAQARIESVSRTLDAAYAKASTLALTAEEQEILMREFPDEAFRTGASGKDGLIYIEHAYLRDRLCEAFGLGQWALITRSRWPEEFTTKGRDNKPGLPGVRIYVEAVLLIRGCFVAEAVGDMAYYPHNDSTNYGDAVEGAKSAALRRCVKELGVGLQQWKKGFAEGWMHRNGVSSNAFDASKNTFTAPAPSGPPKPKATTGPDGLSQETVDLLGKQRGDMSYDDFLRILVHWSWLKEGEPLRRLTVTRAQALLDKSAAECQDGLKKTLATLNAKTEAAK